eukprot:7722109-Lingulodinium_polyedra.AAC.1
MSMRKHVKANLSACPRKTKFKGDALATYDRSPHNTGKLSERNSKVTRSVPGRRQSTSATNTAKTSQ